MPTGPTKKQFITPLERSRKAGAIVYRRSSLTFIPVATACLIRRLGASRDSESGEKTPVAGAWQRVRLELSKNVEGFSLCARGKAFVANRADVLKAGNAGKRLSSRCGFCLGS